jgi:hypothetical protein
MTYVAFKESVRRCLKENRAGLTWKELRDNLRLPYTRACPEWTRRLEKEIGLVRRKGSGPGFIWSLPAARNTKRA